MKTAFVKGEYPEGQTGGNVIARRLEDYVRMLAAPEELTVLVRRPGQVPLSIDRLLRKGRFDLVVYNTSIHGIFLKTGKTVTFFHNVEYSYAKQAGERKIKLLYRYLCEFLHARRSDAVITLNERDSEGIRKLYGRKADLIWPTSFRDRFIPDYAYNDDRYLLFVGSNFFGNTEGLDWFIRNCLDRIGLPLKVVGNGMDQLQGKYEGKNVEFIGYAESLDEYYYQATAVVLPIISGSGMKTKTCEAMMFGKTVIGTDEAFEGYEGVDEAGCIRCSSADDFVEAINHFEGGKLNRKVRELFLEKYEERTVRVKADAFFRQLRGDKS